MDRKLALYVTAILVVPLITTILRSILGFFGIPSLQVGKEQDVNRASSYSAVKMFVDGPVADDQFQLRRDLEAQWYGPMVGRFLKTPE